MNRTSALLELDLTEPVTPATIQAAFRLRAKQAHPDLRGGTDASLRRLILARDLLMHQLKNGVDLTEDIDETLHDGVEPLSITLAEALTGGVVTRDVPAALELIRDNLPVQSLMHRKTLRITLPKGLRPGDRLRLKAAPNHHSEYVFRVEITCDEGTHIAGDDLWMTAELDPRRLYVGGPTVIDTPHGPQDVEIARSLPKGACLCLKGLGLPATERHPAGNLYIRLEEKAVPVRPAADLLADFHHKWG